MVICDEMGEKLSAWQDGELSAAEIAEVEAHLETCPACRSLAKSLTEVDQWITRADREPGDALKQRIQDRLDLPEPASAHLHRQESASTRAHLRATDPREPHATWRRIVSVATAALILIAVSLVILVTGDRADAENAAARMVAIEEIQRQTLRDQEALLQTLAWDLSAMKLKVNCADLDRDKEAEMLRRIDELMGDVERVRLKDEQPKGDDR